MVLASHPATIRVALRDGGKVTLERPIIRGDTLSGVGAMETAPSIPLTNIKHVELPRFSVVKTMGAIVGIGLLGALVGLVIACSGGNRCLQYSFGGNLSRWP